VRRPDVLLTAFSDRPRLYLNDAGWVASNSVLCGNLRPGVSALRLLASWYTPLTLLTSELQIHSLGGGVMIAVPREADSVLILNEESSGELKYSDLDEALRSNDVWAAYRTGESSIVNLVGAEGLELVYAGVNELETWRKSQL
jgi:putative site-specific modification DNA-methyltransferase